MRVRDALTRNRASTERDSEDPRLRGRVYPLPFAEVWKTALSVAGAFPGWSIAARDSRRGEIHVEARTTMLRMVDDVEIRLSLDESGLTRVDVVSASRVGRADFGANARRIGRFLARLDAALGLR